jgi:hypothetical protein
MLTICSIDFCEESRVHDDVASGVFIRQPGCWHSTLRAARKFHGRRKFFSEMQGRQVYVSDGVKRAISFTVCETQRRFNAQTISDTPLKEYQCLHIPTN